MCTNLFRLKRTIGLPHLPFHNEAETNKNQIIIKKTANTIASSKKCRTFAPVIEKEIILKTINGM